MTVESANPPQLSATGLLSALPLGLRIRYGCAAFPIHFHDEAI
jgi:hypothetical protein